MRCRTLCTVTKPGSRRYVDFASRSLVLLMPHPQMLQEIAKQPYTKLTKAQRVACATIMFKYVQSIVRDITGKLISKQSELHWPEGAVGAGDGWLCVQSGDKRLAARDE